MSTDQIVFNSVFPVWLVVAVAIVLTLFFIWKETQRKHRYLTLRIIAQLVVMISLIVLIVRPSIKSEKTIGAALLLTKKYNKTKADSLIEKHRLRVIRMSDAKAYSNSQTVSSWHALNEDATDIRFVMGEGVPASVMDEYNLHFDYIPDELPVGITQVANTPLPLKKDQINFIRGEINHKQHGLVQLVGPSGIEDSVLLKDKGLTSFALRTRPKQTGKFVYQLNYIANGKITEANALPVEVKEEQKLNILFIQQFPTFETRYLKNYLEDKGHAITLRYQVSKKVYRYEYGNRDKQLLPKLTPALLNALDLLFITPESLSELSQIETQALESAINEGLGMILLVSKPVKNLQRFFPFELTAVPTDTATIYSEQWKNKITFSASPWRVASVPSLYTVFTDTDHRLLSGYFYKGAGVISFQLVNETYHLMLDGKTIEYASAWSPLIEHAARKQQQHFRIRITSSFPYTVNEPIHFEVTAANEAPVLYYDSIRIPLKENVSIPQLWQGTVWADESGWHRFTVQDSSQFHFYVSGKGEWNALAKNNQRKQNLLLTADSKAATSVSVEYKPLSPLLFFLLFVLAFGTLWLLAKL